MDAGDREAAAANRADQLDGPRPDGSATRRSLGALANLRLTAKPREEVALERGLLTGVAAFRWAAWAWMAVLVAWEWRTVTNRPLVVALASLALAFTGLATVLLRVDPERLLTATVVGTEVAIAVGLGIVDGLAFNADHTQSFGTAWPLAAVMSAGIAFAGRGGLVAGAVVGLGGFFGGVILYRSFDGAEFSVGVISSMVLYALGGGVAGFVTNRLRESEREIAVARAREEVARTLHDGVLQTLAVVQRRSTDDDLVHLARQQEVELREFLFGTRQDAKRLFRPSTVDLAAALRAIATDIERKHGTRSQVVLVDDLAPIADELAKAVTGAVGEALTNAAKHGGATHVTVYVELGDDGELFCSVKDDGTGFDPEATAEGIGISRSIRGRITDVGGRTEIDARAGRGTEVRLWVPARG